ncbi:acyl carrier protein [Thiovulum sp. ES]|nr:acyl carrier protein [Thiovulum sp. ES]
MIREQIIKEIETLAKGKKVENDNEIIFGKDKLLDSLNVLHILLFIEIHIGIKISTGELSIDNFNTVDKIVRYVKNKR